jgi:plastocyanin
MTALSPSRQKPNYRASLVLVILGVSIIFPALLAAPSIAAQSNAKTIHTVQAGGFAPGHELNGFTPSTLVVRAGDMVVWKDVGDAPHTVTSLNVTTAGAPLFDSSPKFTLTPQVAALFFGPGGFLAPGASFVLNTEGLSAGTYHYQCTLHDAIGMNGSITILSNEAPVGTTATVTVGWAGAGTEITLFSPASITVAHGTKVIFTNNGGLEPHDVVSEVTLSNGTTILGSAFDSSPHLVPPGISDTALNNAPPPFPVGPGGLLLPVPHMDSFNYTFSQPGTYIYYCKLHSALASGVPIGMVGEVIVLPAYASDQDVKSLQSQVASAQGSISSLQTSVSSVSQSVQSQSSQLGNAASKGDLSSLSTVAYAALGIAVVLGIVAIALSRMKPK